MRRWLTQSPSLDGYLSWTRRCAPEGLDIAKSVFSSAWLWPTEAVLDDSYKLPPVRKPTRKILEIASEMGSNGKETIVKAARDTVRLDPAIKRNVGSVAKKAFAASLALAGASLSRSAGAEERLIKGFDAVRACSGDIEKFCSGVERWKFRTKVLDADLRVTPPSGRLAIIMQDEFRNTYDSCGCDDACTYSPY